MLVELQHDGAGLISCLASALTWVKAQPDKTLLVSVADTDSLSRLIHTSLPLAFEAARLPTEALCVTELAERESYLCLHRWFGIANHAGHDATLSQEMARGLAKLTVWAGKTETGSRGEVALAGSELGAWERCAPAPISPTRYRPASIVAMAIALSRAPSSPPARAQVILTTHAALAAYLVGSDDLVPSTSRVLLLDAHLLEEELRRARSSVIEQSTLTSLLNKLAQTGPSGKRAGLLHLAAEKLAQQPASASGQNREKAWFALLQRAHQGGLALFQTLQRLLSEAQNENGMKSGQPGESLEQRMLVSPSPASDSSSWKEVTPHGQRLTRIWRR